MSYSTFKQIVKNPITCGNSRIIELSETDSNSKLTKVRIKGFSSDDAGVKFCFDGGRQLSPYLNTGEHLKSCDAVVLTNVNGEHYLIFIEMKSESIDKQLIRKQFISSLCFLDYCDSILQRIHGDDILEKSLKRFVVFYKSPYFQKKTTRPAQTSVTYMIIQIVPYFSRIQNQFA